MAHQIEQRDSQYGIEVAWHKKTLVRPVLVRDEVFPYQIQLADVAYTVGERTIRHGAWKVPVCSDDFLPVGNGQPINADSFTVFSPQSAWDFMAECLKGTDYQVVSAGTVKNRSIFFVSVKLKELEMIKIADGNPIELIFNFINGLDKTTPRHMNISGIRTVCANTVMMNLMAKTEFSFRVRNTKNATQIMEDRRSIIEDAVGYSAIVKATFDSMLKKPCNADRARRIYAGFLTPADDKEMSKRTRNTVDECVEKFQTGDGNSGRTEYDVFNGLTEIYTRGSERSKRDSYDTFTSSEFGNARDTKAEFGRLLSVNREKELPAVEKRGKELLAV